MTEPTAPPPAPALDLVARRILLICPRFFGYQERIAGHLRSRGAEVDWVDDRASNASAYKAMVRLGAPGSGLVARRHFQRAIEGRAGRRYTDVLVVNPEACRLPAVQALKRFQPQARFALYLWDSFENRRYLDPARLLPLFDEALTFDDADAERFGMTFRPLWHNDEPPAPPVRARYAFSFIGTMHSDRYRIVSTLAREATALGLDTFVYPFLASRALYWAYRLTKPAFRGTRPADFHFSPMPYAEALAATAASVAAVDIEHPRQRGLTMRTFEVLAAGKKLITTNERIRGYDLFSPERVWVVDRRAPRLERAFFEAAPPPWPVVLRERYSIRAWADAVLGLVPGGPADPTA